MLAGGLEWWMTILVHNPNACGKIEWRGISSRIVGYSRSSDSPSPALPLGEGIVGRYAGSSVI
jgi:hypothetical protein